MTSKNDDVRNFRVTCSSESPTEITNQMVMMCLFERDPDESLATIEQYVKYHRDVWEIVNPLRAKIRRVLRNNNKREYAPAIESDLTWEGWGPITSYSYADELLKHFLVPDFRMTENHLLDLWRVSCGP